MRALAILLLLVCSSARAEQAFTWTHAIDVPASVTITARSVSEYKLRALMAQYGRHEAAAAVSVLHHAGDEWTCEIFIGPTPDRDGAMVRELRHCHGWVHQ